MRAIPDLTIKLASGAPTFFERGSLTPNRNENVTNVWEHENMVTRQIISIAVPGIRSDREVWRKLGYLVPLALFGFVGLLVGLGELNRLLPTAGSLGGRAVRGLDPPDPLL